MPRLPLKWVWLAVRIGLPLGALVIEGVPALIGAVVLQEGGLWLAGRFDCDRATLRRVFLAAYALRVAFILPTHSVNKLANGNGALFQDDYTSDLVGEWLVRIARGDGISVFPGHHYLLETIYPYIVMFIDSVLGPGPTPLVPKLLSGVLGALTTVLVFDLANRAFGQRVAMLAAIVAALAPSLVVFSSVTLKEPLVLFVSALGLWTMQRIVDAPPSSPRVPDLLLLMLGIIVISLDLRSTVSLIFFGLVAVVLLARSRIRPHPWQLALASLLLVVLASGGLWLARSRISDRPLGGVLEDVVLQIRHRRAQEAASARSQIRPQLDVVAATGSALPAAEAASDDTPFSVVGDVVEPLGFSLLAPAPWQARGTLELGASLEMLFMWYPLLVAAFFARPRAGQRRLFLVCLVAYGLANWLVLAASEGNLGNLVRHRLMLTPVLLVLGCAGLERLWLRFGARPADHDVQPMRMDLVGARDS